MNGLQISAYRPFGKHQGQTGKEKKQATLNRVRTMATKTDSVNHFEEDRMQH